MINETRIKQQLYNQCLAFIDNRLLTVQNTIADIQKSLLSETKSSAGDKYETGRAMMQLEKDKHSRQLSEALKVQMILSRIDPEKICDRVEFGSVVITTMGTYFIAISAGRIKLEGKSYYVISPKAPLAKDLIGKVAGDSTTFNDKEMKIVEVF